MLLESGSLKRIFVILPLLAAMAACGEKRANSEKQFQKTNDNVQHAKAKSLFEQRCKTAGVVINRTVKDVEGIWLEKIRRPIPWGGKEYFDPMYPEAAMAGEYRGDQYIIQFLMTESIDLQEPNRRGSLNSPDFDPGPQNVLRQGYRFVEFTDPTSGKPFRAQLGTYPPGTNLWQRPLALTSVTTPASRYALDFDDFVDPDDRALWIAGTRLKVIDRQTGEVLATLTRFVWDESFGSNSSGRWPWSYASTLGSSECPRALGIKNDISRKFVDAVLIPKQGD